LNNFEMYGNHLTPLRFKGANTYHVTVWFTWSDAWLDVEWNKLAGTLCISLFSYSGDRTTHSVIIGTGIAQDKCVAWNNLVNWCHAS